MKLPRILLASLGLLALSGQAISTEYGGVAIVISEMTSPYTQVLEGFQETLKAAQSARKLDVFRPQDLDSPEVMLGRIRDGGYGLVLALGTPAAEAVLGKTGNIPVVVGMILRADLLAKSKNATGVILEFPVETQIEMLKEFIPEARRIGVLYNPQENREFIGRAEMLIKAAGLELVAQQVRRPQDLPDALGSLESTVDVLWGIPDYVALNPQSVKTILLYSYRNRIPFIGLSESWVEAGALYALDRDYKDIGRQCADVAIKIQEGTPTDSIVPAPPRRIVLSINRKASSHMKLVIPESLLRQASTVIRERQQ